MAPVRSAPVKDSALPPVPRGRQALSQSLTSIVDQGWLSLLNLGLGLLLIRLATKDDYGLYSQLFVAGLFATTVVEALVSSPLTTLASSADATLRESLIADLSRLQQYLAQALALVMALACAAVTGLATGTPPWVLSLCFGAYVYTYTQREYKRTLDFIDGRPDRVLLLDGVYGLALIAGVSLLTLGNRITLPGLFGLMALANLLALAGSPRRPRLSHQADRYRKNLAAAWQRGRLALPGALSSWVINYSYLYITALWLGTAAAADLQASRLLLMPLSLCVVAWARVACPMMGRLLHASQAGRLRQIIVHSAGVLEGLSILYICLLWLMLPWLEAHVLGDNYRGLGPQVLAWGVYFMIYDARWIGTALLMAGDQYRTLLIAAVASLALLLVSLSPLLAWFGTVGALIALSAAEILALLLLGRSIVVLSASSMPSLRQ